MGCCGSIRDADADVTKPHKVSFEEKWTLGEKIGQGSFGQICTVRDDYTGEQAVCKLLYLKPDSQAKIDEHLKRLAEKEANIWQKIGDHKHLVELYETFLEHGVYFLVMEMCACDLTSKLSEMQNTTQAELSRILKEMLLGIEYVHSMEIVHRDIKPENFLLGGSDGQSVKLCDFGLATELPKCGSLTTRVGTAPYMSPEMLVQSCYGVKTDTWSFGVVVYVILFGKFPYGHGAKSSREMKDKIISGQHLNFAQCSLGDEAAAFARRIWSRVPATRLRATDMLRLDFFRPKPARSTKPSSSISLVGVAEAVRQASNAFTTTMDPTVQRGLEELREKLMDRKGAIKVRLCPSVFKQSFSLPTQVEEEPPAPPGEIVNDDDDIIAPTLLHTRNSRKFQTHTGTTSAVGMGDDFDSGSTEVGEGSQRS